MFEGDSLLDSWKFNVPAAIASGAFTTYVRPADLPRWAQNSLHLTYGLVGAAAVVYGVKILRDEAETESTAESDKPVEDLDVDDDDEVEIKWPVTLALASGVGAVTVGVSVLTLKADSAIERALVRREVARPRLWMGVAVGLLTLGVWALDSSLDDDEDEDVESPAG